MKPHTSTQPERMHSHAQDTRSRASRPAGPLAFYDHAGSRYRDPRTFQLHRLHERQNHLENTGVGHAFGQPHNREFWNRGSGQKYDTKRDGDEYGNFHCDHRSNGCHRHEFHDGCRNSFSDDRPGSEQNYPDPVCAAIARLRCRRLHPDKQCLKFTINC